MDLVAVDQNIHFLRQGADLLRAIDDGLYRGSIGPGGNSVGIGPHFRHCLDFYVCFLRDLGPGRIDYDRRQREPRLETDRLYARAKAEELAGQLAGLDRRLASRAVEVRTDVAPGEDPLVAWAGSTVARELRFLVSHTVHHYALIAHLLRQRGHEPGAEFGVAPSTLAHWTTAAR